MHFMIYFHLNDLEIGKGYNLNSERFKLGMVSSFDPHNMCAKVETITAKTGCTSCRNWTISFKVQGFQTKAHLIQSHFLEIGKGYDLNSENSSLTKTFHFSKLISTQVFFLHPTCIIQSHILKFEPFVTSLAILDAFNDLFSAK